MDWQNEYSIYSTKWQNKQTTTESQFCHILYMQTQYLDKGSLHNYVTVEGGWVGSLKTWRNVTWVGGCLSWTWRHAKLNFNAKLNFKLASNNTLKYAMYNISIKNLITVSYLIHRVQSKFKLLFNYLPMTKIWGLNLKCEHYTQR